MASKPTTATLKADTRYNQLQILLFHKVFPCQDIDCRQSSMLTFNYQQECNGFHSESEKRRFPFYEHMSKFQNYCLIGRLKSDSSFTLLDYFRNVNGLDAQGSPNPLHLKYLDSLFASTSVNKVCLTQMELTYHPLEFKRLPCSDSDQCIVMACPYFHSPEEQREYSLIHQFLEHNAFYPLQSMQRGFGQNHNDQSTKRKESIDNKSVSLLDWESNPSCLSVTSSSIQSYSKINEPIFDDVFRDLTKRTSQEIHRDSSRLEVHPLKRISTQRPMRPSSSSSAKGRTISVKDQQLPQGKLTPKHPMNANWHYSFKPSKPKNPQIVFNTENDNLEKLATGKQSTQLIDIIDIDSKPSLKTMPIQVTTISDSESCILNDRQPAEQHPNTLKRDVDCSVSSVCSDDSQKIIEKSKSISMAVQFVSNVHCDLKKIDGRLCKQKTTENTNFVLNKPINLVNFRMPLYKLDTLDINDLGCWINGLLNASGGTLLIGITAVNIVKGVDINRTQMDNFQICLDNKLRHFRPVCFPENVLLNFHEISIDNQFNFSIVNLYVVQIDVFNHHISCIYTDSGCVFYAEGGSVTTLNTTEIVKLIESKSEEEQANVLSLLHLNPLLLNRMNRREVEITIVNLEKILAMVQTAKSNLAIEKL
jgi:hypothetical protein